MVIASKCSNFVYLFLLDVLANTNILIEKNTEIKAFSVYSFCKILCPLRYKYIFLRNSYYSMLCYVTEQNNFTMLQKF